MISLTQMVCSIHKAQALRCVPETMMWHKGPANPKCLRNNTWCPHTSFKILSIEPVLFEQLKKYTLTCAHEDTS